MRDRGEVTDIQRVTGTEEAQEKKEGQTHVKALDGNRDSSDVRTPSWTGDNAALNGRGYPANNCKKEEHFE